MVLVQSETDLRELVREHAADLPPQQRIIADYLLEHLQTVPFLSVPELARRSGVSDATVVRFAQRIGYAGFSELKMELVELLQGRLANGRPAPAADDADVLEAVARLEIANVRRTIDSTHRESFRDVAEAVFSARHTFAFGMGVSAHLADLACYALTQVGVRATPLSTRFSSPREQVVALRNGDLLLAFSFPPYSRPTLEMLGDAAGRGIATVAVCDRLTAPASQLARWTLPVKSENMMFTNAIAAVTVLLNALATEIATSHRSEALEALAQINRILAGDPEVG